jgi:hypothetical protein
VFRSHVRIVSDMHRGISRTAALSGNINRVAMGTIYSFNLVSVKLTKWPSASAR